MKHPPELTNEYITDYDQKSVSLKSMGSGLGGRDLGISQLIQI